MKNLKERNFIILHSTKSKIYANNTGLNCHIIKSANYEQVFHILSGNQNFYKDISRKLYMYKLNIDNNKKDNIMNQ